MGLSFHYRGSIANPELLPELIDEIQDIAKMYNWKYFIFDRQFPENSFGKTEYNQNIYGICFTPPNCETIDICFLSNGRMSSISHLKFFGKVDDQEEQEYLYMLSVKRALKNDMQFAHSLGSYFDNIYKACNLKVHLCPDIFGDDSFFCEVFGHIFHHSRITADIIN